MDGKDKGTKVLFQQKLKGFLNSYSIISNQAKAPAIRSISF